MNHRLPWCANVCMLLCLAACARHERAPLPGDSVSPDGAITLTPGRVPAVPAASAREPLSAIESRLYAAELVMEHQGAIDLRPAQRDAIANEVERAHTDLLRLQWELDAEKEKLVSVLDADTVDEARAKRAAGEVMKREDAIKTGHLAMLVRIKNVLTKEQQDKLRAAREADRCGGSRAAGSARDGGADAR